jgi:nucleoside-diphosphate-sugar epimerase
MKYQKAYQMKSEFKHVAIVGGLGHIGSGWVRVLNSQMPNLQITIIDNFLTQRYNSLHSRTSNVVKFIEENASSKNLESIINSVDMIFHFAAITNMDPKLNSFSNIKKVNISATRNLVNTAKKLDIPLVFLSSTSVYEKSSGSVDEDSPIAEPVNPYSLGKLIEENIVRSYPKGTVLRLGTIHGISPGMRFHTVVNRFCWQVANELPLTLWSGSKNITSPYLSLTDLYSILNRILQDRSFSQTYNIFNLVSHNSTPLKIVEIIKNFKSEIKIQIVNETRARLRNVSVGSKHQNVNELITCENPTEDIQQTLNLLSSEDFCWNKFYDKGPNLE